MNFRLSIILLFFIAFTGCKSKLDKLLMSNNVELKEQKAKEYFENCDYSNASPLFKDLIQSFSTSAKVEKMYFYYAYCDYKLEDYLLGAFEFKKILNKFPRGVYAERAQFLLAMCYFKSTPKYNLDQEYNKTAIEEFQVFLEKYPESENRKEANEKIDELIVRSEQKHYESSLNYYGREDYKSAIYSFQQILDEFPDTKKQEELRYLMVSASFLYAEKSIESKKSDRYKKTNEYAKEYLKKYQKKENSEYLEKVKNLNESADKRIQELTYSLPFFYFKKKNYDEASVLWESLYVSEKDVKLKNEIANNILFCAFNKALEAGSINKIELIQVFLEKYRVYISKVNEDKKGFWTLKYKYMYSLSNELPLKIPYSLVAEGQYKSAYEAFKVVLDTSTLNDLDKSEHFYFYLMAKYKFAKSSKEDVAFIELSQIVSESNSSLYWKNSTNSTKIEKLIFLVKEDLTEYPMLLVTKPMKRKEYRLAIKRAKELIEEGKVEKNQEEIVYLLIVSSLKNAQSGKRYDKLAKYEFAILMFNEYQSQIKDASRIELLKEIKVKIENGINKYQTK